MLVLSVPSSGGTVTADLLRTLFRDLSDALPLAQAVKITRSVAYFHNAAITSLEMARSPDSVEAQSYWIRFAAAAMSS